MNAIISRSPESATQATPAARERKAANPAASSPPTELASAPPATEAADWQRPVRAALIQIAGLLDQLEDPVPAWANTDAPTELISHAARRVKDLLRQEDGEEAWASSNTMWDAILWPFESLRAAVELGALRGWAASTPEAFGLLTAANDKFTALQEYVAKQPVCASKPFQEKPRPPIRREPEGPALDAEAIDALADEATRVGYLVQWCVDARGILSSISTHAAIDPELRAVLQRWDVCHNQANWDTCLMDQCLSDVLRRQASLIFKIAGAAQ